MCIIIWQLCIIILFVACGLTRGQDELLNSGPLLFSPPLVSQSLVSFLDGLTQLWKNSLDGKERNEFKLDYVVLEWD